ncbi:chemotaxis protein CheX [Rubripirellula reticaptiva]|nr:chemotaxis protein CheX [Rubripirellula reticaptiva]
MNDEVVKAFKDSTTSVFETMLGSEVTSGEATHNHQLAARGVSGIIGLTGSISGDVIICFDEKTAIAATAVLLGMEPDGLDGDVIDAVGELTNMIAGNAKGRLEKYDLSLALPTVITGTGHRIGFKSGIQPVSLPFISQWGNFSIELVLAEVKALQFGC